MRDFFAKLYEWFGLVPFYSNDLGEHLKGFDITCTGYMGTPLYVYVGAVMIAITVLVYILYYHVLNSPRLNRWIHWWLFALTVAAVNFFIAFILPFNDWQKTDYCMQLRFSATDCVGFGISNAVWSFVLFLLLTSFPLPRKLAGFNMTDTTFWKPRI